MTENLKNHLKTEIDARLNYFKAMTVENYLDIITFDDIQDIIYYLEKLNK